MMQNNAAFIIGLTGPSGAGKGEICRVFADSDALIIDTDSIAHNVIKRGQPAYDLVLLEFGEDILDVNAEISRKKLGAIVFNDKAALTRLSSIVHRFVKAECERTIKNFKGDLIVIDAPVLIEAGMQTMCDIVVGVFADDTLRKARIMARDGISEHDTQRRISSQMKQENLRQYVDFVIENNSTLNELQNRIDLLLKTVRKRK